MALSNDDLREIDHTVLEYLAEGRVTPAYSRDRMQDEGSHQVSGAYVGQRLKRLEEHGHVENLYNTGLYELVSDPRKND